ncbi:MAG: protein kinase [Polyangiaceae bacterium]|nr:protein kinase [Polyangiaceae bacterium]
MQAEGLGETLRERLDQHGALPWQAALPIAVQLTQALAAAHQEEPPRFHGDLRPEHIRMSSEGRIGIGGFGMAVALDSSRAGALTYLSPERIEGSSADAPSDLYSLGLVLYEMLSGAPPFQSSSIRELVSLQCEAPPPPLPESLRTSLPHGIETLLLELLEKRPEDRPPAAVDVLHDLEHLLREALPESSSPEPASDEPSPAAPPDAAPTEAPPGATPTEAAPGVAPTVEMPAVEAPGAAPMVPSAEPLSDSQRGAVRPPNPEPSGAGPDAPRAIEPTEQAEAAPTEQAPSNAPRQIPGALAWTLLLLLCLLAGGVTYWFKAATSSGVGAEPPPASDPFGDLRVD